MGVVFIGAAEPFFSPTVAMRWGIEPPSANEGADGDEDREDSGIEVRTWDEGDAALHAEHRAAWGRIGRTTRNGRNSP
jgi:hypothetical protein